MDTQTTLPESAKKPKKLKWGWILLGIIGLACAVVIISLNLSNKPVNIVIDPVILAAFVAAFFLIILSIVLWVILKKIYTTTPSDSSQNKPLLFGCGSLIVSFACLVTVPITFVSALAYGMGATDSNSLPASEVQSSYNLFIVSMILLPTGIIITIFAGIVGAVTLAAWMIKKYKTRLTNTQLP